MKFRASTEVVVGHESFDTFTERDAFVARFPKYVGLHSNLTYHASGEPPKPSVTFHVALVANGVNGGVNETGVKRARRLLAGLTEAEIGFTMYGIITTVDELKELLA